jgi:hypothetical protein
LRSNQEHQELYLPQGFSTSSTESIGETFIFEAVKREVLHAKRIRTDFPAAGISGGHCAVL